MLVVYATVTTIVTPVGGLLIGVAADQASLWWALAGCGLVLVVLALALRTRLTVFDPLDEDGAPAPAHLSGHHLALSHLSGADLFHHTLDHLHHRHHHTTGQHGDGDAPGTP